MPDLQNLPAHLKAVKKSDKSGNLIVPGRGMYVSLFTAVRPSRNETDPKRFQYGATILIPAGCDVSELEADVQRVFKDNVPEAKRATTKWRNPLKKTADEASLALYADDYPYLIRPNAKQYQKDGKLRPKPDVVDHRGVPVPEDREPEETYNGRWMRVSVQPYWYPAGDGMAGVSLGLVNAQLVDHDEPLAGGKAKASSDFEAVDGVDLEDMGNLEENFG